MNGRPHILVICDVPGNTGVLHDTLADLAEVSFGSTGEQGVSHAQAWPPALILLAAKLQDMDGTRALKALKKDPRTAQVPVLFMVERGDADTESRALLQGVADVIHTPVRAEAVRSRVQLHLRLARLDRPIHAAELVTQDGLGWLESLDDLIATAQLAVVDAAAGLPVEDHCAKLLDTGQRLKHSIAPVGTEPAAAAGLQALAPLNPTPPRTESLAPSPGASDTDHLWLPLDPR
jgi:PleD family two-component response regulator